jgi:hypothetical protein
MPGVLQVAGLSCPALRRSYAETDAPEGLADSASMGVATQRNFVFTKEKLSAVASTTAES